MGTKPELHELTLNQLRELSRVTYETIIKRLAARGINPVRRDGRAIYYRPWEALPAIFNAGVKTSWEEKARLDKARAEVTELDLARKRGELVPVAETKGAMVALATAASVRLQGIGSKLAAKLAAESEPSTCQEMVQQAIHEALHDLADAGRQAAQYLVEEDLTADDAGDLGDAGGDDTPAETDGEGVGRARKGGLARKRRGRKVEN